MASPAIAGTTEGGLTAVGTSLAVTLPSGGSAADFYLIVVGKGATAATLNALTDWTEVLDENVAGGLAVLYYTGSGVPSDPTFTQSASTRSVWAAYRITGADRNIAPQVGTTSTGSSANPDPPSVTVTNGPKDILAFAAFSITGAVEVADTDILVTTFPTNYNDGQVEKTGGISGTNLAGGIGVAGRQVTGASSENPGTFTQNASRGWRAQTIIVHPIITPTATSVLRVSLASASAPDVDTGHVIKVRARKTGGTGTVNLSAALYEGATNRSGNLTSSALTTSLATYSLPIPEANVANITSYADLELRIWGDSPTGDTGISLEVADAWLETPAPSTLTEPYSASDSFTQTEGTSGVVITQFVAASDSAVQTDDAVQINVNATGDQSELLNEAAAVSVAHARNDAATFTEGTAAVTTTDFKSANEAHTLVFESAGLVVFDPKVASDSFVMTEQVGGAGAPQDIETLTLSLSPKAYWHGGGLPAPPPTPAADVLLDLSGNNRHLDLWNDGDAGDNYPQDGPSILPSKPSQPSIDLVPDSNFWKNGGFGSAFEFGTQMSLSIWMKPRAGNFDDGVYHDIVRRGNDFGFETYYIGGTSYGIRAFITRTVGGPLTLSLPATQDSVHLLFTWGGGDFRLYVNGVQHDAILGAGGSVNASGANFVFGRFLSATNAYDGLLDEVSVFDYALSPMQVQSIYSAGAGTGQADAISAQVGGSETHNFSEGPITMSLTGPSDPWAMNEAPAVTLSFDAKIASDSSTFAESLSLAAQISAAETNSLSEIVSILANVSGSDSSVVSELAQAAATDFKTAFDSALLSEQSALHETLLKEAVESFAMSDGAASIAAALNSSDAATLDEVALAAAMQFLAAADSATLAELSSLTQSFVAEYTHTLPPQQGIVLDVDLDGIVLDAVAQGIAIDSIMAGIVAAAIAEGIAVAATADGEIVNAVAAGDSEYHSDGTNV